MLNYVPKYFTNKAIALYFIILTVASLVFFRKMIPLQFMFFGAVAVVGFFYFSNSLTLKWQKLSEKKYIKNIFKTAFIIRLIYVIFSYFYYQAQCEHGFVFEFDFADSAHYHWMAAYLIFYSDGFIEAWNALYERVGNISDMGYALYLGYFYKMVWWSGEYISEFGAYPILFARIVKAVLSAYMCVLIYKLTKRNFGESTGRIAGILSMLMPHFIYYCGLHLKEMEMVFLTVLFVERADHLLRSKKYNFLNIAVPILLAGSLFTFRTVLGAAALIAFFSAIVFSTAKVVGWKKRVLIGVWIVAAIGYFAGGRIAMEVEGVWADRQDSQEVGMEWRAQREGGNEFARYGSVAVFAPMIFVIPFPTMINIETQRNMMMMNGSNFVKNITAFFTMLAIFLLVYRKKWREHTLILAFLIGYLAIIAMSNFAHSERFHLPSLPFALIMASYGISQMDNQKKKYFNWWTMLIFVAVAVWSWIKLAGRGLV